ncbi:MAG TPA: glycosyltransferase family 4 protein [Bryobacteraceae bacterium]|nr:glycosyltransferase family 4 protein [Bryobacteraceae bacterium]
MTPPGDSLGNSALFVTPEEPRLGAGGGALRSASLLEYLRTRYDVRVATFEVPPHSKSFAARAWRNSWRLLRGVPPLIDRFAGFEAQLAPFFDRHYRVAVIEHFWCAPYAAALRPHCDVLVLDLHNVESALAATHARATKGVEAAVHSRFAEANRKLEREWIPQFDLILTTSAEDRARIEHPNAIVFPNAIPVIDVPRATEENCIVFSGNLEYHPNIEAVRWFGSRIWPRLRSNNRDLVWKLVGRNQEAITGVLPADPRIILTGPIDDAVAEIAKSRVVVVPLLSGSGTRFKILEAWAARRAIVSTTIGAEGLLAREGEHLSIADEPAEFCAAVQTLLDHPGRARALGEAGHALYLDRYTWPAAWKTLKESGI